MADWDAEEAKYSENPETYIENLGKELDQQRASQAHMQDAMRDDLKWITPRKGARRNYNERNQRGFHHTFPPKEEKRRVQGITDKTDHSKQDQSNFTT